MAENTIAYTPGSGAYLHAYDKAVGGTTVKEEVYLAGEPGLASYTISGVSVSIATANAHTLQIMAGASLPVYLRRLTVYQQTAVSSAAFAQWQLWRLSTAGTGGTSLTPAPLDTTDAASGATAMTLPTAKGTETTRLWAGTAKVHQTITNVGDGLGAVLLDLDFDGLRVKAPRIAAGTSNGLALKWVSASTSGQVFFTAIISEATF